MPDFKNLIWTTVAVVAGLVVYDKLVVPMFNK
jgi:hypothetical protein